MSSVQLEPSLDAPILRRRSWASLADLAYESIVAGIFEGRLPPGTPLNIDALRRELAMSNTPLREALSRLAAERLAVLSANRGYTVAPRLSGEGYHQLFDLRYLLEIHALEVADVDSDAIDRVDQILGRMVSANQGPEYRDFKVFSQADREFHHALVSMSRNEFLVRAWTDLHFHLHVGRLYGGTGVVDYGEAVQEHRAIVDALRIGDKQELIRLDALHIKRAEERLESLLTASVDPEG